MPQYWILKTEPTDLSCHHLEADGRLVVVPAMGRKA